jgi:putative membrane protein
MRVHTMGLLIIAIDRDNDLGRKTGIRSPVIGREPNVKAALELGLADPEESDTNTMLEAIRTYDQLIDDGEDVEVVTICGDIRVGTKSDMKIANTLDQVIAKTKSTRAIIVSDGSDDLQLEPIIRSRLRIDSTRMVVVQQSRPIEDTLYTIVHKMEDPKIQRQFILPIALIVFVWGLAGILGLSEIASGLIWVILSGYLLVKVAGWEDEFRTFYNELLTTSERVSVYSYVWLIAILLFIVGVAQGIEQMDLSKELGVAAMVLAFLGLDGILPYLLSAIICIEVSRTIDTYVRDGIFNINIIRFIFTVVSLGVITAGIIDIMSDVVVRTDLAATEPIDYTQGIWFISLGLLIAFIGRIVFDILRERITEDDSSSDEKLTIDE